jgi:hypothetical protein
LQTQLPALEISQRDTTPLTSANMPELSRKEIREARQENRLERREERKEERANKKALDNAVKDTTAEEQKNI